MIMNLFLGITKTLMEIGMVLLNVLNAGMFFRLD